MPKNINKVSSFQVCVCVLSNDSSRCAWWPHSASTWGVCFLLPCHRKLESKPCWFWPDNVFGYCVCLWPFCCCCPAVGKTPHEEWASNDCPWIKLNHIVKKHQTHGWTDHNSLSVFMCLREMERNTEIQTVGELFHSCTRWLWISQAEKLNW